jgi:hypothetical protein
VQNKPLFGGCMVAAKTFQEWYAFFGGEEMAVSRDDAAVVWEAATKAAEARFTSHNRQITKPASCEDCEFDYASITCSTCAAWPANKHRQAS